MSAMSNYLEKKLLDHSLGKAAFTMPTTVYLALFTADPGETGSLTAEVSGGGYARQAITATMSAAGTTTGQSANGSAITFGPSNADWGTISHVAIIDAQTGGNVLYYGPLAVARTLVNGDSFQLAANQLTVTLA